MKDIMITKEPVELYKILKFEGIADSGGEAKAMIDARMVMVNGMVETRKRNKIVSGDLIEVRGHQFKVIFSPQA